MSESFYSERFRKKVWLTNHSIEAMAKRKITFPELKELIEYGDYIEKMAEHGWVYYEFPEREDNLVCAAVVTNNAIIVTTVMIR